MKYLIEMRNPVSLKVEAYETEADSRKDLQLGLDFWEHDVGYTIISVKPI